MAAAAAAHCGMLTPPAPHPAALLQSGTAIARSATRAGACSTSGADLEANVAGGRSGFVGASTLGGESSLGASQLLLLSGSSQLLALAPHFGQSTVALGATSHAPQSIAALSSPSLNTAVVSAAASSEMRSQQLAADLYARVDQHYLAATPRSAGDVEAGIHSGRVHSRGFEGHVEGGAVGDSGNYELTSCSKTIEP